MPAIEALYYPQWDPPSKWLRSSLLFFDKVSVVVPTDATPTYCEGNLRIREKLPESFGELRERRFDPQLSDGQLRSLAAALDDIRASQSDDDSAWHHQETTALHDGKVTHRIADMLRERGLIYGQQDQFIHTSARVAYLILSLIADRYGTQRGLWTVTDDQLGYSANVLSTTTADSEVAAENCLAAAVLSAVVPEEIDRLSPPEFVELRNRYEPSRATLQAAVREMAKDARLRVITDPEAFKQRIDACTSDFIKSVEQVKASKLGLSISSWGNFGIGTMVDIVATLASLASPFAGLPVTAGWRLIEMGRGTQTEPAQGEAHRVIAGLRRELIEPSLIQRLRGRWRSR